MVKEKEVKKDVVPEKDAPQAPAVPVSSSALDLLKNLAAGMYYYDMTKSVGPTFESLTAEEIKPYFDQARYVLQYIDKLNMAVMPKIDMKKQQVDFRNDLQLLTSVIEEFVKHLKTTKPDLFPCGELAYRILK